MCSRYAEAQCCICSRNSGQSNNRIIIETCGHQKCWECLIKEENGCSLCSKNGQECGDSASAIPSSSGSDGGDGKCAENDEHEEGGIDCALTADIIQDASHIITIADHVDGTVRYKCTICQKQFKSRNNCKYHLFCDKSRSKPFQCNQCGKQFITLAHMNYHQSTHSIDKRFPCTQCQKVYSGEIALKKHLKKHQNDFKHQCPQCAEKFLYKEQLNIHQNRHNNIFHKCPEVSCGKRFLIKSNLTKHILSHTGLNRKVCPICSGTFSGNSALKTHMLTHSKSKSYQCKKCSKKFIDQRTLERHGRTHLDNQFYECTLCPAKSGRKDNIRRHVRNLHSESDDELRSILQKIFDNFNKKKIEITEKTSRSRDEKTEKRAQTTRTNELQEKAVCAPRRNETSGSSAAISTTNVVRNIATSVIKFVGRSQDIHTGWSEKDKNEEHSSLKQTSLGTMSDEKSSDKLCHANQIQTQKLPSSVQTIETGTIDSIAEIGVNLPSLEPLNFDPFPDITPLPLLNTNTNLTVYRQLLSPYLKKTENSSDHASSNTKSKEPPCESSNRTMIIDRPPKKMIEKYEIFRK